MNTETLRFTCTSVDAPSGMFTAGKTYRGQVEGDVFVVHDNNGHRRVIGATYDTDLRFIVGHSGGRFISTPQYARFLAQEDETYCVRNANGEFFAGFDADGKPRWTMDSAEAWRARKAVADAQASLLETAPIREKWLDT